MKTLTKEHWYKQILQLIKQIKCQGSVVTQIPSKEISNLQGSFLLKSQGGITKHPKINTHGGPRNHTCGVPLAPRRAETKTCPIKPRQFWNNSIQAYWRHNFLEHRSCPGSARLGPGTWSVTARQPLYLRVPTLDSVGLEAPPWPWIFFV